MESIDDEMIYRAAVIMKCDTSADAQMTAEKLIDQAVVLEGTVKDAEYSYERIVKVKPVEHHYEDEGEPPYIKYGCPICESFGNRSSIAYGRRNCLLCNINLLWDESGN